MKRFIKEANSADWICIGFTVVAVVVLVYAFWHGWNVANCEPATNGNNYGC